MESSESIPEIIQMKYPAPYSQSWTQPVQNSTDAIMSYLSKNTKLPVDLAAYSKSWTYTEPITLNNYTRTKSSVSRHAKDFNEPLRQSWVQSQSKVRGPDPIAPHLKYGIFPSKRCLTGDFTDPLRQSWLQSPSRLRASVPTYTAPHMKYGMFQSKRCLTRLTKDLAPYSKSWTSTEPIQNTRIKSSASRNAKDFTDPLRQSWLQTPSRLRASDPSKNDLFSSKRTLRLTKGLAAFSKSWTYSEPIQNARIKPAVSRNAKESTDPLRQSWLLSQSRLRGSDPVAPHVKNYLFSPKRSLRLTNDRVPHSKSSTHTEPIQNTRIKSSLSRNAKDSTEPLRQLSLQSQSRLRGSDPTASHLKYGMFPSKRCLIRKGQSRTLSLKPTKHLSQTSDVRKERKRTPKKGQLAEAPLLIIRNIHKQHTRELCISEIMHVDIKPRRNPPMSTKNLSPIRFLD